MQIDPERIRPELRRIGKVGYAINLMARTPATNGTNNGEGENAH